MTLYTAVSSAALRVIGSAPAAVFASTEQIAVELRDLAQDVAVDIATSHEWRDLVKIATFAGGASFPKPADYDRMLSGQGVQDGTSWLWGYSPFASVADYMAAINGQWAISPGGWIILGGEFKFWPATVGSATFPYMSNLIVNGADATPKAAFSADTDTFALPDRLLTLGLIWRYRAQKGLDYSEDLATYEDALARAQNNDKGARVLRPDSAPSFPGAKRAYINRAI